MSIDGGVGEVRVASSKMLFIWEGEPDSASLVLTSCGVKPNKHHSVYVNGHLAVQVDDDPYSTGCRCDEQGYGIGGQTVAYSLGDSSIVINGWNYISITNDADVTDDWVAYGARLVLQGEVTQTLIGRFDFTSSHDGSSRFAKYQLPIGYDPGKPVPLLVSIAGTDEDRKWEDLYRFAADANERGWLVLSPNLRNLIDPWRGRTASLPNQHDIMDAINYMVSHFAVDSNRIYMSGFSTGGGVAATMAAKYPHVFAAVVDWAGPTDLGEWDSRLSSLISLDFGCPPQGPGQCPVEWQRRSARSMTENLKHVPMTIVHGRADTAVPFEQSEKFYQKMSEYYDPASFNKQAVWHDGGHADALPTFDGLEWMSSYVLNASPTDIMIRADEDKDYYWISIVQKAWTGKFREGWSAVLASYDSGQQVISATVKDGRLYESGYLPLDVSFHLSDVGLDPGASYTIEDYNETTGDFVLRQGVIPVNGRLTVSLERDAAGGVHHQYQIYPFAAPELIQVSLQQHSQPDPEYAGVQDTYIYQYDPTRNFGSDYSLKLNFGRSLRSLLEFDLSTIPQQAVVKKAHVHLHLNALAGASSINVGAYQLLTSWADLEANWNDAYHTQAWTAPGADYVPTPVDEKLLYPGTVATFNVRSLVSRWLSGDTANEGLMLMGPLVGSGNTHYSLASSNSPEAIRRPRLEVWYMLPEPTPTPTATPVACALVGTVTLQGRPAAPGPRWITALRVKIGDIVHSVVTDDSGRFAIDGLQPGVFDISVKNDRSLSRLIGGVTLSSGTTELDFGLLLEGDANNDDLVNISDFSVLATGFYPAHDERADFNRDGLVNINDFSLLAVNFGTRGERE